MENSGVVHMLKHSKYEGMKASNLFPVCLILIFLRFQEPILFYTI